MNEALQRMVREISTDLQLSVAPVLPSMTFRVVGRRRHGGTDHAEENGAGGGGLGRAP
jgi:hypothetical protein